MRVTASKDRRLGKCRHFTFKYWHASPHTQQFPYTPSAPAQCLKKKKMLENEVNKIDNMIMRVIEQKNMMEGQRTTVEVVSTMHKAAMDSKQNMKVCVHATVQRMCSGRAACAGSRACLNDEVPWLLSFPLCSLMPLISATAPMQC